MHILFPGRHQLLTDFQFKYLYRIIQAGLENEQDVYGNFFAIKDKITDIVFAVTSANHSNTRRNPLPFYLRAITLESFSKDLNIPTYIYGIDDVGNLPDFASYIIKRIKHESDGQLDLKPSNTIVVCSTPVMKMYEKLGFKILPAELLNVSNWEMSTEQPWDLVEHVAQLKSDWRTDKFLLNKIHPSSYNVWLRYSLGDKVKTLFSDKIVGEDGDITATRDYNTYVRQMDEIAEMKYNDTAAYIRPGRIGDIGCAVGSWIKLACEDERLRESDFYGIEVSRHLFDICQQRKHNGEFANPFVFFAQKNAVTGLVFESQSMNTIFTSSLTHEIESYGGREDLLNFIKNRFEELVPGGVWVNRDVVGPEDKDQLVLMKLSKTDGRNGDFEKIISERKELANYLTGLSTYGRFLRFANDFRKKERYQFNYKTIITENDEFIELTLRDATEFITKKDYIDNWQSEMHETFAYWSFNEWKEQVEKVGFQIVSSSVAFSNPWIVENRFKNKVSLFKRVDGKVEQMEYPVTNMFLIAEKKI
jgi:SAM-dependent methyltransferase